MKKRFEHLLCLWLVGFLLFSGCASGGEGSTPEGVGEKASETTTTSDTLPATTTTTTTVTTSEATDTTTVISKASTTIPSQPSKAKFAPIRAYTDCSQVQVAIKEIKQQDTDVFVVIEQNNQSDDVLSYGAELFLYRVNGEDMEDCRPKDYRWNAILYQQFAGSIGERKLNLSDFDVFVEGDYQLQYAFCVNGQQHKAYFEFSVSVD